MSRHRDPVNEMYDHGCDLVEAASALRRGAGDPDVAATAAALVGCVEVALRDLAALSAALESGALQAGSDPEAACGHGRVLQRRERMRQGFANLQVALADAAAAAAAARSLAARGLSNGGRLHARAGSRAGDGSR